MTKFISKIVIDDNICRVYLIGGGVALVDKSMKDHIKNTAWYSVESIFGKAAARFTVSVNGSLSADFLQNVICEAHNLKKIYALSGDLLDCRKENLTVIKPRENAKPATCKTPKSGIEGIEWVAKTGQWAVFFSFGSKRVLLQTYDTLDEARLRLVDLQAFHGRKS